MGLKLVVIGGGEMLDEIRKIAGPSVRVLGSQPFDVLRTHYSKCQALVFPGEEDFGMVPVEAMASGRPVIAYGRGGAVETVADGVTGVFFMEQTVEAITSAVKRLSLMSLNSDAIAKHAARFGREPFLKGMTTHINSLLAAKQAGH